MPSIACLGLLGRLGCLPSDDVRVAPNAFSQFTIRQLYIDTRAAHMVDMALRLNGAGDHVTLPAVAVGGSSLTLQVSQPASLSPYHSTTSSLFPLFASPTQPPIGFYGHHQARVRHHLSRLRLPFKVTFGLVVTVQVWVYASTPMAPGQSILEMHDSPTSSVLSLSLFYSGRLLYVVDNRPDEGATRAELVSPYALPRMRWTHVAITQVDNDVNMLWDGVVVVSVQKCGTSACGRPY